MALASRLRAAREAAGMTQEDVAVALSFNHRAQVSNMELGLRRVLMLEVVTLAQLYRLPITHFTEGL